MSRIGNNPITIPDGVTVEVKDSMVTVKGKLGELSQEFSEVEVKLAAKPPNSIKQMNAANKLVAGPAANIRIRSFRGALCNSWY